MSQLDKIKEKLTEYTKNGGDINKLKKSDPLYQYIKNTGIFDEDGKKVWLEKKFEMAGFKRESQRVMDVKQALIDDINNYLKEHGDFYSEASYTDFPFYERTKTYKRSLDVDSMTFVEVIKSLGFEFDEDKFNEARPENKIKRKERKAKEKESKNK